MGSVGAAFAVYALRKMAQARIEEPAIFGWPDGGMPEDFECCGGWFERSGLGFFDALPRELPGMR